MVKPRLVSIMYGWVTILGVMLAASLILSLLLRFSSLGESTLNWTTLIVSIIALFAGGLIAGAKGKEKGWLLGGLTGIGFTIFILLYQYLGYGTVFSLEQTLHHAGFLIAALFGGIFGVNVSGNQEENTK
ncbi:TIGR04086 family membrane protein [Radiobacillus kanasensis]|uniref:TIGR04086 family membrane protein n=1 Tax=Radiobacillus kanasensis TaxID=2844358 RepID=UPI001E3BA4C2|nr:TIGR04086 family membrane protein [Radiobacillus kanasensis]UFT97894.1 TIGR04086 family membrane protein [Radiobacillus kanasensis]